MTSLNRLNLLSWMMQKPTVSKI